jgi:hypothetical protein
MLRFVPGSEALFRRVAASNRRAARTVEIPTRYQDRVRAYAAGHPDDGRVLLDALERRPDFHRDGWIMRLQPRAAAMTLGTDVFLRRDITLRRYVHELVHVYQYCSMGTLPFLEAYFGGAARELLLRMVQRRALDPMTASPLEAEAYDIDRRFTAWERQAST